MIRSVGIDVASVDRVSRLHRRYGDRFAKRVLGPRELDQWQDRGGHVSFLAGRFAAKEAVIKALGAYLAVRPAWSKLQVINDAAGRPQLHLSDDLGAQLDGACCHLSISHERQFAAAVAIFTEDE